MEKQNSEKMDMGNDETVVSQNKSSEKTPLIHSFQLL